MAIFACCLDRASFPQFHIRFSGKRVAPAADFVHDYGGSLCKFSLLGALVSGCGNSGEGQHSSPLREWVLDFEVPAFSGFGGLQDVWV